MDLAPRDGINILDHAKLHAMIACTGLIGSPHPADPLADPLEEALIALGTQAGITVNEMREILNARDSRSASPRRSTDAETASSSGVIPQPPSPHAGAAAAFNLDACMRMGDGT